MAKVDLSSQAWCDLVFSGKNKAYGAYKMRETSPRRHNIAVILVIVIALIGFSILTVGVVTFQSWRAANENPVDML